MERQEATWNHFCTQMIQKLLLLEVLLTFLSHEEQTEAEMATLGQEIENLRSLLKEYHVNAVAVTSRTVHVDTQGRQKTTWFRNYCHTNGNTLNWCRRKMRDEELQKRRFDMSSKRINSPIKKSSTKNFNRRPPNYIIIHIFLDQDDRNSPTIEQLSNKEANWQHEAEQFYSPERKCFPRNKSMSFNLAELTSIGESDGESSDPLSLGY